MSDESPNLPTHYSLLAPHHWLAVECGGVGDDLDTHAAAVLRVDFGFSQLHLIELVGRARRPDLLAIEAQADLPTIPADLPIVYLPVSPYRVLNLEARKLLALVRVGDVQSVVDRLDEQPGQLGDGVIAT